MIAIKEDNELLKESIESYMFLLQKKRHFSKDERYEINAMIQEKQDQRLNDYDNFLSPTALDKFSKDRKELVNNSIR